MRLKKKRVAVDQSNDGQNIPEDVLKEGLVDDFVYDGAPDEDTSSANVDSIDEKDTIATNTEGINTVSNTKLVKKTKSVKNTTSAKRQETAIRILKLILHKTIRFFIKAKELITYVGEKTVPVRRQIRFKLVAAFIIPVICIIILGVSSYNITKNTLVKNSEDSAGVGINSTSLVINLLMDDIQTRTSQIAGDLEFVTYYNTFDTLSVPDASEKYQKIKNKVGQFKGSSVAIYNIYAFGSKGKPVSTLAKAISDNLYTDFASSEEFKLYTESATKKGGATSAWLGTHAVVDTDSGSSTEFYSATYIRDFAKGDGYIVCDLLKEKMNEVLKDTLVSEGSLTAFITSDGRETVVKGKKCTVAAADKGKSLVSGQSFFKKAQKSKELSDEANITYGGKKYLFVYSKIGETGAIICTLIPQSDILGKLKLTRTVTIILVVISSLVAFFVGLILATDIAKVINKFSVTFKHVSAGDFTVRLDSKRKDEFGALAHDMDDMLVKIRDLVADMANFGHNVSDAAYKVSGASGEILSSISEVSETVNVMNQGVSEQAKDTEKSFIQMTDFAGQIGEAYEGTEKVGQVASKTKQTISSGRTIVDDLMQQVNATSEVTGVIIKDIDELQQQSKSIGSVVETINEIASTTNLLSLNASIEAARAGDAGRGFAVVADQIRSLAEQSVESVKRIEKIIKAIQQKTQTTVTSAKNAEQLLGTQTEALNNTVQVFQDVDSHMVDLLDKIDHITQNMQTITVSKDEVLDSIKNIAAVTQQTLASSEVVGTNINTQITSVETLNVQAEEMREKAKELEEAIDKFTI